jgi:hypothetical protein
MEVDHFDPRQKKDVVQRYENLFLASRHCNGAKRNKPTPKERSLGLTFINPCEDWDYGKYIFEDPRSHKLVGITPQARYHIRYCDLNADHLVTERRDRTELASIVKRGVVLGPRVTFEEAESNMRMLREQIDRMIPEFPPPPHTVSVPEAMAVSS